MRAAIAPPPPAVGPCIPSPNYRDREGYSHVRYRGRMQLAHRVAWMKEHSPIPAGMTVDHVCFNPGCINVAHLRLLTAAENAASRRGTFKTECKRGHSFTPENTYTRNGRRTCRKCNALAQARRTARRKARS